MDVRARSDSSLQTGEVPKTHGEGSCRLWRTGRPARELPGGDGSRRLRLTTRRMSSERRRMRCAALADELSWVWRAR